MRVFGIITATLLATTAVAAHAEVVYSYAFADATTGDTNVIVVSPVTAAPIEATADALAEALKQRVTTERPNRSVRSAEARIFATYLEAAGDRSNLLEKAKASGSEIDQLASGSAGLSVGDVNESTDVSTKPLIGAATSISTSASGWPFTTAEAKQRQLAAASAFSLPIEMTAAGREFVLIPPGEFVMGSSADEPGRRKDEKQLRVKISEPFYFARDDEELYKTRLGYADVETWIANLQSQAPTGFAFRLPTEAEWEYAARAGKATPYYTGDAPYGALHNGMQASESRLSVVGWGCAYVDGNQKCRKTKSAGFKDITTDFPESELVDGEKLGTVELQIWDSSYFKARQFQPNPWGLFDVYGRFRELTSDFYGPYATGEGVSVDPRQKYGEMRVARGGSYRSKPEELRSAARQQVKPAHLGSLGYNDTGLRLVLFKLPE